MKFLNKIDGADKVVTDSSNRFVTDTEKDTWNGKVDASQVLTDVPANAVFTDTNTVTSINGKTGAIAKADIVALGIPAQDTVYSHPATHSADMITDGTTNKAYTATEKAKLAGIATSANNYSHPPSHPASMIVESTIKRFVSDAEKAEWNSKSIKNIGTFNSHQELIMYAITEQIPTGQYAFFMGDAGHASLALVRDAGTYYEGMAQGSDGLYVIFNVTKQGQIREYGELYAKDIIASLDDITSIFSELDDKVDNSRVLTDVPLDAKFTDTVYTHPTTAGNKHIPIAGATSNFLVYGGASGTASWSAMSDTLHGTRGGGTQHSVATTSANGFMSGTDKTKIDSIESGAEVNNISDVNALDLTDGGNTALHYHSADRVVEVASGGNLIGSKPRINIIDSATVSATIVDNTLNNRVDITLNSIGGTAESVTYDNTSSGMSSVNVQDAIDELDNLAHSHSNKVVLDELSDIENQLAYKGTVISGGSDGIFTFRRQEFEATEGQTLFTITNGTYTTNSNRLSVYIWGIKQPNTAYTETSTTSFTMNSGLTAGTRVLAEWIEAINVEYFTGHATSHRFDGVDPITPIMIGAEPTIVKNTAFNKNYGTNVTSLQPNDGASLGIIDEVARIDHVHPTDTTRAGLISPAFTGNPTVAGPLTSGDSSNKVATTKFVGDSINDFAITKTGGTLTGILNTNSQIKSTVPTGTAPLTVTSTTKVTNLNADLLDGNDSTYFTNSSSINYDNTISGLSSSTVKTAIDELSSEKANLASPTFTGTVSGVSASMVGLGNVTNESKATMFTSPTFTGTVTLPSTTSIGNVSSTEIDYLDGVTSAIQTQLNNKANKSTIVNATLLAASWTGASAPYSYSLTVSGVTTTSNQELIPTTDVTDAQIKALQAANITDAGQSANTILLKAWGTKPTINLPIRVVLRGDM